MTPFLESAAAGGVLVVGQIKVELDKCLGREVTPALAYNLLHRHNWRKLAPEKRHPQSDPLAQEEWQKNSPKRSPKSDKTGLPSPCVQVDDEYTYAYGTGQLDSLILPHVNTGCMQLFLDEVSARHPQDRIIMVIDGEGWHGSDAFKAPQNIRLLKLPPYAPELNTIEHVWDELREKFFHNRVFDSLDALEAHLSIALKTLEDDVNTLGSIIAWP